jgi:hypothetical protein
MLIDDLQLVVASDRSPPEKLEAAIHRYVEIMAANADLASVLLLEYRSLAAEYQRKHIKRRDRFEALWRQILQEGMDQGYFEQADTAVIGFALLGAQNWLITWFRADGPQSPEQLADQFSTLFLNGLSSAG